MFLLPIKLTLLPQETLTSYIARTAQANNYQCHAFCNKFVINTKEDGLEAVPYEPYIPLTRFCKAIGEEEQVSLFYNSTLYPSLCAFMSYNSQAGCIGKVFSDYAKYRLFWGYEESQQRSMKACPFCMREDKDKYGFWYLHKEHQYPGVFACYKHHNILYQCTIKKIGIYSIFDVFDESMYVPCNEENVSEEMVMYAEYVKDIVNTPFLFESNADLSDLIQVKLNEYGLDDSYSIQQKTTALKEIIGISKNNRSYDYVISRLLNSNINRRYILEIEKATIILQGLVPNVRDIKDKCFKKSKKWSPHENNDYELIQTYPGNAIKIKCNLCHKTTITTKYALSVGFGCPCKRNKMSENEIVSELFRRNAFKGDELLEYDEHAKMMTIYNSLEERNYVKTPESYLIIREEPVRPKYKKLTLFDEVKEKTNGKFIFNRRHPTRMGYLIIECSVCHKEKRALHSELAKAECHLCKRREKNLKSINELLRTFGNGEYELGEDYSGTEYFQIRHKKCGEVYSIRMYDLRERKGLRCKRCYREETETKITEWTRGEFELAGDCTNRTKIPIRHKECQNIQYVNLYHLEIRKSKLQCKYCKSKLEEK